MADRNNDDGHNDTCNNHDDDNHDNHDDIDEQAASSVICGNQTGIGSPGAAKALPCTPVPGTTVRSRPHTVDAGVGDFVRALK